MNKKVLKNLLVFFLLTAGLLAANFALAQNFGTNEVSTGLAGSLSSTDPRTIVGRIINIALGFLGVIAVGLMIYAGFLWMTSGGDEEKITTAKKILKNAAIGLVIILSSWAIATFIISRLSGAVNGTGGGCLDGESRSCGCGGAMVCSGGSYGSCVGSDCSGGPSKPTSCDASVNPGCQAAAQICASTDYCDDKDCGCKAKGNLGDPCDSDLTNTSCNADNNRCSEYLTCNPSACTCYGLPIITAISPLGGFCDSNPNQTCTADSDCATTCNLTAPNGAAGNFITIIGKNFGVYSATSSRVIFEGNGNPRDGRNPVELNSACTNTWRDNEIVVAIPGGVSTGAIKVINSDNLEDTTNNSYGPAIPNFQANNIARPGLCYLSPNSGVLSSQIGYQGINLYSGNAYFGNYQSNVRALNSSFTSPVGLTGTSTTPNIKSGESGSFVQNNVNGHSEKSNYLSFTKEPEPGEGPFISSFIPIEGNAGQYVTIRGNGFGGARGTAQVFFGNSEAAYDFPDMCLNSVWKNNQIIVKVPTGLADGYQVIKIVKGTTTLDTQKLNPNTFHSDKNLSLATSLCKIDPEFGPIATPITLWGEYFGQLNNEGLIHFNYQKAATGTIVKDGRADTIKTAVPAASITGPVRVIKNSRWGNELNFSIGECAVNSDCGTQVCCPPNTYKKGRCANTIADCFINIPTSVFEWSFSTGFGTSTNPYAYSCSGLASYFGSCQTGKTCPNVPGTCSPYAGGGTKTVGNCDYSCATVAGCGELGLNNCIYNASIDKCLKNGTGAACDLSSEFTYSLAGKNYSATRSCNKDKHWEIIVPASCPDNWTRASGNRCVNLSSNCSVCSSDFTCENISEAGRCVSKKICLGAATCADNPILGEADKCVVPDQPTCDCCCTIGSDARDCCAPLKCEGACGSDIGRTSGVTLGSCGGCAAVGTTPAEHDAACNCSGHSGQFCNTNNPAFPDGVCTDCSNLSGSDCTDHSSACCLDAKKTPTTADDICRGGNGLLISSTPGNPGYGYCAYYDCSITNPTECASTTPIKFGNYASPAACAGDCANSNPCPGLNFSACQANSRCCFDSKNTPAPNDDACVLGTQIAGAAGNPDKAYCAYYNCEAAPLTSGNVCASTTPQRTGIYNNLNSCAKNCANPPTGPGLSCAGQATSTCATDKCTFAGFGCFSPSGALGTQDTDCGACCCQPGAAIDACAAVNLKLKCLADKGDCSGANRGLCCGCSKDDECGSPSTVGCGADTCCQARPTITSTAPAHMQTDVCRNAVIKIDFDQTIDSGSLAGNVLLLEERAYGNGVCPAGTFVAAADSIEKLLARQNRGLLARLIDDISHQGKTLAKHFFGPALADTPNPNSLYCAMPGTVAGETNGNTTSVSFSPKKLLAAAANYYLIVLGDTNLNSQSGVLSFAGVGFNGLGYKNAGVYIPGKDIKFNNKNYINSQIIKFSTLSDQGPMAGICALNSVKVSPSSYLFSTTDNGLDEDDANVNNRTFDTVADKDKVFTAQAYSLGGQPIQPVTAYFWNWDFQINNPAVASIVPVTGLARNKVFVSAASGVTDAETQVKATVNMSNFLSGSCSSGSCSCLNETCSSNCCNAYSGGNNFNQSADIYVFLCKNPWPPVAPNGLWSPWADNCVGSIGGACSNYNYKFYYCRDAGASGTLDDLPAIINQAVIRGQSANLICSSDRSACSTSGIACGSDKTGDGIPDGLCIWNVLKESYFFREAGISGGEITTAVDLQTGGAVRISWQSAASQVGSYKVYYLKSGKGTMLEKAVAVSACVLAGNTYNCNATVTGLINDVPYVFKVSVVSVNKVESQLSSEKSVTPTDKTPPAAPGNFKASISSTTAVFSWAISAEAVLYRLYHGVGSGAYGESFDSASGATSLSFDVNRFASSTDYFTVTAIDQYKNESAKSRELSCSNRQCVQP
ncbi:MAG: IPT/TIG domain-containing protein [bacterium]|nr:IPT/TIG domain-containing protein [bacterium]